MNASPDSGPSDSRFHGSSTGGPGAPVAIEPIVLNAEGETIYEPHSRDRGGSRTHSRPHTSVRVMTLSGRSGWLIGLLVLAAIPVFLVAGVAIALIFGAIALLFWLVRKLLA